MSSPCKMRWCERFVQLDGEPIRFAGRPYLPTIYSCEHGNLVLRCARQTEKSTLLCNTIVWQLCTNRHTGILFVTPREEQGRTFVRTRLLPVIWIVCAECHRPIDPTTGRWVARNPGADWGEGYCIAHPMVPWMDHHDLLEKQRSYDPVGFKNEVLGLPSSLGDHVITRAEIEACCGGELMAQRPRDIPAQFRAQLVAGIDWGGGSASRTVLTVGLGR